MGIPGPRGPRRRYHPGPNSKMTFALPSTPKPKTLVIRRNISSPPALTRSPSSDSGYGSGPATPPTPTRPWELGHRDQKGLWMLGDGNQSDSDEFYDDHFTSKPEGSSDTEPVRDAPLTPSHHRLKPETLPTGQVQAKPELPSSFRQEQELLFPQRPSNVGKSQSSAGPKKHLDRFIPARSNSVNSADTYWTSRPVNTLTPSERLLRHDEASEDAFFSRRNVTPLASGWRFHTYSETSPSGNRVGNVLGPVDRTNYLDGITRQVSNDNVWAVGGLVPGWAAVNNGRGQFIESRTNARLFRTSFPTVKTKAEVEDLQKHEARIAAALGLDRTQRVLDSSTLRHRNETPLGKRSENRTRWTGTEWANEDQKRECQPARNLPTQPFKVLDAPNLRDDFYFTLLAYSAKSNVLAVALGDRLYKWSEKDGAKTLNVRIGRDAYLTSVAFSSTDGGKDIIAFGRGNGTIGLMALSDDAEGTRSSTGPIPRFEFLQPVHACCLSWKPTCTPRASLNPIVPGHMTKTEDLLVGDMGGHVYWYAVEWPERWEVERDNWPGQVSLLMRISVHTSQVCGLSWSRDGELLATGSNDNFCCLFETSKVLSTDDRSIPRRYAGYQASWNIETAGLEEHSDTGGTARGRESSEAESAAETEIQTPLSAPRMVKQLGIGDEKHRWQHGAAVKAIAFCPWQKSLVATGGGSQDKCIHFFHTTSGAALATISVSAQVTSLIWSTTRREIAATFGYTEPEHSIRIAVFSWPDCRQVAAIPWQNGGRALYAVPFPSGPRDYRSTRNHSGASERSRTSMEGCIMVASSDKSVKFHEVWGASKRAKASVGMLCGSDILEGLEGFDRGGDIIR